MVEEEARLRYRGCSALSRGELYCWVARYISLVVFFFLCRRRCIFTSLFERVELIENKLTKRLINFHAEFAQ